MIGKAVNYLKDVRQEMSKVSWPTREELRESTVIVLVVAGILALYMFIIDTAFTRIVQFLF